MNRASKKKLLAAALVPLIAVAAVGSNSFAQMAPSAAAPMPPDAPNASQPMPLDAAPDYFANFTADSLDPEVKAAVIQANLAPVSFRRIVMHTRDEVSSKEQGTPQSYTVEVTFENAGHGLVRRKESAQGHSGASSTRLDLAYRGYFPFVTQNVPADKSSPSPAVQTRKVLHFDTKTEGHFSFAYLYGAAGQSTFADPGQVLCDSGKRYPASQVNPSMQGEALELNCQHIDNNGMITNKVRLAYLENYGVAVALHMQNPEGALDSTVTDFTAQ